MAANTIGGLRIGYIVTIRAHIHGSEQHNINIDPGPGCINIILYIESSAADVCANSYHAFWNQLAKWQKLALRRVASLRFVLRSSQLGHQSQRVSPRCHLVWCRSPILLCFCTFNHGLSSSQDFWHNVLHHACELYLFSLAQYHCSLGLLVVNSKAQKGHCRRIVQGLLNWQYGPRLGYIRIIRCQKAELRCHVPKTMMQHE
jgi:hypothetical protein